MSNEKPVMLRAAISESEWKEFRKLAIDLDVSPTVLAGQALRDKLEAHRRKETNQ